MTAARDFGCVAVIMGGRSEEREVSLNSGRAVLKALQSHGVDAVATDVGDDFLRALLERRYARCFNILHGRGGEDGVVQGLLDSVGVPYTGSGVLGSALTMDKSLTKAVFRECDIPTPESLVLAPGESPGNAVPFPVIVKPVRGGSTIGIRVARDAAQLQKAVAEARRYDAGVLIEQYIKGAEYTVGILGGEALPVIKLETPHEIYDFAAKYEVDTTRYLIPSGLSVETEQRFRALALKAFQECQCRGWGRVDLVTDTRGNPFFLEINTAPGMTAHSLVPMAAKAVGIDFAELCWRILETTLEGAA